jgi:septal ring factor EnvC (AmiA/AmiB activator)
MRFERSFNNWIQQGNVTMQQRGLLNLLVKTLGLLLLSLILMGVFGALQTPTYAQELQKSESPAPPATIEQLAKEAAEWRETLRRAVDKLEAQQKQLEAAETLITLQKQVIESLEKRDQYREKEIEALRNALTAESRAKQLEAERATLAESQVKELDVGSHLKA